MRFYCLSKGYDTCCLCAQSTSTSISYIEAFCDASKLSLDHKLYCRQHKSWYQVTKVSLTTKAIVLFDTGSDHSYISGDGCVLS